MTSRIKTIIKMTLGSGLVVAAMAIGISQIRRFSETGEEGLQVWFYDQSEQRLYAVPRETIPPHKGDGGQKNDGVRAVVVAGPNECQDPDKRRIAYLETFTPELKELMEGIAAARVAGRPYGKPIPGGESGFYEKNTLVRRVDDPTWHDMTSVEGRKIVVEWRSTRCSDGSSPVICSP